MKKMLKEYKTYALNINNASATHFKYYLCKYCIDIFTRKKS